VLANINLAMSDDHDVSLGLLPKNNGERVANHVQFCPDRTPDVPFDSIHLVLRAETVNSSTNCLCVACEDGYIL
jgi:hypothetical protein